MKVHCNTSCTVRFDCVTGGRAKKKKGYKSYVQKNRRTRIHFKPHFHARSEASSNLLKLLSFFIQFIIF